MVYAALADTDAELAEAPIGCCRTGRRITRATCWSSCPTPTAPRISSPTRRTGSPDWTGIRIDSKDPIEGGEEAIAWWRARGQNPNDKLAIFSDGLDVDVIERHPPAFPRPHAHRLRLGNPADERFPRPGAGRRARSDLHRLQGHLRQRPPDREALRQSHQGDGAAGRDRALQARLPGRQRRRAQPVLV